MTNDVVMLVDKSNELIGLLHFIFRSVPDTRNAMLCNSGHFLDNNKTLIHTVVSLKDGKSP